MAGETVQSVHVNQLLSNLAVKYAPDAAGFVADIVCPRIPVVNESDLYPVFNQEDFYSTSVDDLVPDRSEPKTVEFGHSTARYQTHRRELAWDVTDRERKNADSQLRLETNKQTGTQGLLALRREIRVANLLRKTTNGGQLTYGVNASQKWDDPATTYSQIMKMIGVGKAATRAVIGMNPNTIVIPAAVAEGMQYSAYYQALQYQASTQQLVSDQYPVIPPVISGMRVLIPGMIQNTAAEGLAGSYSDIWGESVRLLYVAQALSLDTPSVAYTFQSEPTTTRQWREDKRRLDAYATGSTIEERVVGAAAGYEINDTLT